MRKRLLVVVAANLAVSQMATRSIGASVPIEQIEAYENYPVDTLYAPTNFYGALTVTEGYGDGGQFYGITFNADPALNNAGGTLSGHANTVGNFIYGSNQSPAYPYVTEVYNTSADQFLNVVMDPQGTTGVGPLPGTFAGGAKIINNSYVAAEMTTSAYQDDDRRLDYVINQADVVWVAGAVTGGTGFTQSQYLAWSNFNALAVSGVQNSQQNFSPTGSPGKKHADLSAPGGDASFGAAMVSGYAAALWGTAETANEIDAEHGAVIRSLLMAGADKGTYTRPSNASNPSAGALDPINGAGQPDYDRSLSILGGGEKSLLTVSAGGSAGPMNTTQQGWAEGNIASGSQAVVLFQSSNTLTGLTASLNWNVTSQSTGTTINTSSGAVIFPSLVLDVCPVTYNASKATYALGAIESSYMLQSAVAGDNVQYLYSTTSLPAGSYAFLITGDTYHTANVGFSYTLSGSFASQWKIASGGSWGNAANWNNGIPNGQGAQANLLSGTSGPTTITLDGDRTIGQLTFNSSNSYTIARGTVLNGVTGQLVIDDTGDSSGTANPLISVQSGNQTISAQVYLTNGVTANLSSGAQLTLGGALVGYGTLNDIGAGSLTLDNANIPNLVQTAGTLNIPAGANVNFSSGGQVTGSGILNLNGTLITGALKVSTGGAFNWTSGTLNINGTGSSFGGSIIVPNGGTLKLDGSITNPVTVNGGSVFNLDANPGTGILVRQLSSITLAANGQTNMLAASATANRQLIVASALNFAGTVNAWGGLLDLANNDLDVSGGNLATITNQIREGYNNGNWNGTSGIVSTSAASAAHLTALGVIQNNQSGLQRFSSSNPFDTFAPGASDILVKYTYYGDANLDGKVDGSDYSLIDSAYSFNQTHPTTPLSGWYNGDFNFDGVINGSDYTLIDNAYDMQSAAIQTAIATSQVATTPSAVPEPGTASIIGLSSLALLARRRRLINGTRWAD